MRIWILAALFIAGGIYALYGFCGAFHYDFYTWLLPVFFAGLAAGRWAFQDQREKGE